MACLEMYNSDHKGKFCPPLISPRISFSNDFVDSQQIIKQERTSSSSSSRSEVDPVFVSTDFEFSVTNYSMMTADELFSKGRLLPFKDNNNINNNNNNGNNQMQRTIRDELLAADEDDDESEDNGYDGIPLMPPKGTSTRWKGLLGLKRSHIGSKKVFKGSSHEGSFGLDQMHVAKSSQENSSQEDLNLQQLRS